ncbi:chaplin [Streptomyces sp. NPDC101165]|uniref:chaplin n=1 Tax=Streptomyces sp. NPDC101165 TaxID=3366119 RepID=UPI0037FC1054
MRIRSFATTAVLAGALALTGTTAAHAADPNPVGVATDSPGVLSGNVIQIPLDLDANLCGDTIDIIGLLNPALANTCTNG